MNLSCRLPCQEEIDVSEHSQAHRNHLRYLIECQRNFYQFLAKTVYGKQTICRCLYSAINAGSAELRKKLLELDTRVVKKTKLFQTFIRELRYVNKVLTAVANLPLPTKCESHTFDEAPSRKSW